METERAGPGLLDRLVVAAHQRGILTPIVPVAAFLIYFRTLSPGMLPGDSGEFQFAAWGWTLAHPTGYPLYLLLGGIWQHLVPFGDPAFRLNLLSAVFSAIAVMFCYRIFVRIGGHRGAALIATLTFAVSPTFWRQATEAEVYALNTLLLVILTWLALKWQARRDFRLSAAWAFTFGLALTHHRSIILMVPGFAAFFAGALYDRASDYGAWRTRLGPLWLKRDAAYVALAALPLLLYLYIPLRAPATPYLSLEVSPGNTIVTFDNSPAGWVSYVAGKSFQNELVLDSDSVRALESLPARVAKEFNALGAALGLSGLFILLFRRRWGLAAFTIFGLAAVVLFNVSYHIGDIADYYTPVIFLYSIWIAAALGEILQYVSHHTSLQKGLLPTIVLLVSAALLPVQNFSASFVEQDKSLNTETRTHWETVLNSSLPANSILISNDRDEITPMWYLQLVDGVRPDTLGLFPLISAEPQYANVVRLIEQVIGSNRPVFLVKPIDGVALKYRLEDAPGGLLRVVDAPFPQPARDTDRLLGDQLRVLGYTVTPPAVHPDSKIAVSIFWQVVAPMNRDYTASLQIFDRAGRKLAQAPDHRPGAASYPTSMWRPGERLRDVFNLTIPPDASRGTYHLFVRVYDAGTEDALGDLTEIGTVRISQ